ncbi:peroxidase 24-like protein [Tanacetum coccineum]
MWTWDREWHWLIARVCGGKGKDGWGCDSDEKNTKFEMKGISVGLTTPETPNMATLKLCKASGGAFFKYDTSLAARDAVSFQFRRDMWPVFTGRKDGRVSLASEVGGNLPSANANFTTLLSQFGSKGLNLNDLHYSQTDNPLGISRVSGKYPKVFFVLFAQSHGALGAIDSPYNMVKGKLELNCSVV